MGWSFRYAASIGVFLAMTSAAHATIGCAAISSVAGAGAVNLYFSPDETSTIMREIPLGDIVEYPDEVFAPSEVEGWAWVRHDITQEAILQSGVYGWMRFEDISDCG